MSKFLSAESNRSEIFSDDDDDDDDDDEEEDSDYEGFSTLEDLKVNKCKKSRTNKKKSKNNKRSVTSGTNNSAADAADDDDDDIIIIASKKRSSTTVTAIHDTDDDSEKGDLDKVQSISKTKKTILSSVDYSKGLALIDTNLVLSDTSIAEITITNDKIFVPGDFKAVYGDEQLLDKRCVRSIR
jgi:hypothetical protein